jgi:adenosylmethionine-8-amino-7-oxononanoate aminotransferase
VFDSGDGAVLRDVEGKEYLDAMAGITVAHLGHGRTDIARVAFEQVTASRTHYLRCQADSIRCRNSRYPRTSGI